MLKIFSSQIDHPLADEKEADRIFAELAGLEAKSALKEVADWIESVDGATGFRLDRRVALITRFDDVSQPHVRVLVRDFLIASREARRHASVLLQSGRHLWQRLALAYMNCFETVESAQKSKDSGKRALPHLCVRLLRAHAQWLKWCQLRYGPVDPVVWQNMGAAYLAAVEGRWDQRRVAAFGEGTVASSPQDEYVKALVFNTSAIDHLKPVDTELTDKLAARFVSSIRFGREQQADSVFWIDPARPMAPMRLARAPRASPTLRYFGMSGALPGLMELMGMARKGELPSGLDLGGQYPPKMLVPVLLHLSRYWAAKPPARAHPRHAVRSATRSVIGFAHIFGQLSGKGENPVRWEIQDVSRGGFGVQAVLRDEDDLRLGMLLALQPEGGDNWLVGIIRRIARDSEARGRLGIETLSAAPAALKIELNGEQTDALLLDPLDAGATVRLGLPQFGYGEAVRLNLRHAGRVAELEPMGLLESVESCDLARYRVAKLTAE